MVFFRKCAQTNALSEQAEIFVLAKHTLRHAIKGR